ncbi:MAG: glycerol-3-phosphate dehydrogenase, partial [Gaiellales bacterium]|nr:glycerol-3-phosphate dehydrogenase [Gaiellales bacterium]
MGAAEQTASREDVLDLLGRTHFDLLVIGGGIIGCAVAWLGARAGLRVALVERGDLAGQTSSASSKLIHGGLRYLQMGDIGLVREAHAERHALARTVAPHLVRPRAFLVPVYRGGPVRASTLRAGLVLYGGLGRFADGGGSLLRPAAARALVPPLRTTGLRSAGRYVDHETNDARLTIAVARAAARAGAAVATRVEVQALRLTGGRITGADCV